MVITKCKQSEEQDFNFNVLDLSKNNLKKEELLTELLSSRVRKQINMREYDPFKDAF